MKEKELENLDKLFVNGLRDMFDDGTLMHKIFREGHCRHFTFLRDIAQIMHLTFMRKGELKLSKNGLGFLKIEDKAFQFRELFYSICYRYNWVNDHYGAEKLQNKQDELWGDLIEAGTEGLPFSTLATRARELTNAEPPEKDTGYDFFAGTIELGMLRYAEKFGIVKISKSAHHPTFPNFQEIDHVSLTELGYHVFMHPERLSFTPVMFVPIADSPIFGRPITA